jgi:hypothetical protein
VFLIWENEQYTGTTMTIPLVPFRGLKMDRNTPLKLEYLVIKIMEIKLVAMLLTYMKDVVLIFLVFAWTIMDRIPIAKILLKIL